ncbi:hypothetical protein HDU96_004514 [Phlyctochytrium bullatum]|nr:hypothetical protein HDU96_004514 [Phlyctochytrium bullatum]
MAPAHDADKTRSIASAANTIGATSIMPPGSPIPGAYTGSNSQPQEEKRVSMLDIVRETLQRQGKVGRKDDKLKLKVARPRCFIEEYFAAR